MQSRSTSVCINYLNKQGYGVAANPPQGINKIYLAGSLPGETVKFAIRAKKHKACWGMTLNLTDQPSPHRVQPRCQHAPGYLPTTTATSICGGCSLQHLAYTEQLELKQQKVQKLFAANNLQVKNWAQPLYGEPFGYRHQARIGVRWVKQKNKLLVGFREMHSSRITDCRSCQVLIPSVGNLFDTLAECLAELSISKYIAQVEVYAGDKYAALVIRNLQAFSSDDLIKLSNFGSQHSLAIYTQSGGIETIAPLLLPDGFVLEYEIAGLNIAFTPSDFIQNNLNLNRKMVAQALDWLAPKPQEIATDLFCGIGNFSLPLAKSCRELIGVEGSQKSVAQAIANAQNNAIHNSSFYANDLANSLGLDQLQPVWWKRDVDIALLDPPRSGAASICEWLEKRVTSRLLYVSCNPDSLAKDLIKLSNSFEIERVGMIDMFAHTLHCEVMCLLKCKNL